MRGGAEAMNRGLVGIGGWVRVVGRCVGRYWVRCFTS